MSAWHMMLIFTMISSLLIRVIAVSLIIWEYCEAMVRTLACADWACPVVVVYYLVPALARYDASVILYVIAHVLQGCVSDASCATV